MLVLTRRLGEQIVIDGNITLTILALEGGHVRIGIRAPPEVIIDREEVHERRREFATTPRKKTPTQ
jgi:carbon storage regulator